jgi:hypothetical protein
MEKDHGKCWKVTIQSIRGWLTPGSILQLNEDERTFLFQSQNCPAFRLIVGDMEEAYPLEETATYLNEQQISLFTRIIPANHFSYFHSNWEDSYNQLRIFLAENQIIPKNNIFVINSKL